MSPSWDLGIGDVSEEIHALMNKLSSEEGQIAAQQDRLVRQAPEIQELDNPLIETIYKTLETQPLSSLPASMSLSFLEPNTNVVIYIERLLNTIDRLRGERDSLSRDVEFLESESRFTIEALEAKLSASVSSASDKTVATISQLKIEMDQKERRLQDVESERDSLKLQITNLMMDMQDVQEELNNAEGRYTTLQFHQLSNMTNSEATRNLRGQIEELENRIMRRTEQIGIHQHDIKRLETNLRLQEERLSEMTTELETMAAQKDTMVEDCADAREARDVALIRVERLEEELETLDGQNVKRLETNIRLQEERLAEMTTEFEMMAAQKDAMVEDCADAREARDGALIRVGRLEEELESSDVRNVDNAIIVESLIATIFQTVCQARETIRLSREEVAEVRGTHAQQSTTIQQLQEKETALRKSIQEYQLEVQELTTALSQCQMEVKNVSALATNVQQKNCELVSQLENGSLQIQNHETTINDLRRSNQELRSSLQEHHLSKPDADDAERKLALLKLEHAEAIGALQALLVKTSSDLEEVQTRYTSAQDAHQRTIQEANSSILELEKQLGAVTEKLAELELLREQYNDLKEEDAKQQSRLQEELTRTSHSYQGLKCSRDALQDENVRLTEDLTRIQKEHATQIDCCLEENRAIEQELEQQVISLQGQIEEQGRLLDISEREVMRIRDRLQEEAEGRAQDKKQHAMALSSEKEHNEDADETISRLRGELETLERNLQQTNMHLQTVDDEKLIVRQQMTELEAEVQRSKSLIHYLEIQIKDSDQLVSALKGDIERTKADLARSEKSWKTAEVNLSLQNAQRKREMTELERELSAFRAMPNLEQVIAELEERNSEMEELLRNKCVEVEENDDRALEMLKEKKKLTTKVESLTRKVQNLQAKLAAARALSAAQLPESQPTHPASLPLTSPTPQFTSAPILSRPRSATVPSAPPPPIETPSTSTTQNPSNRVVSGPSFLPRPKTPERRTTTPVFKARTPERQMQPEIAPILPAPVIGKKRAAPDDFGAYGNLPAQAFTADGEDIENKTPRERKVLNSLQSGFTPVRNQSSRPVAPSPKRGAPTRMSPFISDLTNSPHLAQMNPSSAKPSKQGWLGKIRGNSHATDRPQAPGMRPMSLFDRGDRL